jgi:hypothetical protein
MTTMLRRVAYVSQIAEGTTDEAIKRIVAKAQLNNRRHDLSGVLALGPGLFAQILEGAPDAVEDTLTRIRADERHLNVRLVIDVPIQGRLFDRWSMELLVDEESATLVAQVGDGRRAAGDLVDHLRRQHERDPLWWTRDIAGMALAA